MAKWAGRVWRRLFERGGAGVLGSGGPGSSTPFYTNNNAVYTNNGSIYTNATHY